MIRMTPQLQQALEALDKVARSWDAELSSVELALVEAFRAAGPVEGKWFAAQEHGGWFLGRRNIGEVLATQHQRTAEAYRDALNAADAALDESPEGR